jgi:hypothetical protein
MLDPVPLVVRNPLRDSTADVMREGAVIAIMSIAVMTSRIKDMG